MRHPIRLHTACRMMSAPTEHGYVGASPIRHPRRLHTACRMMSVPTEHSVPSRADRWLRTGRAALCCFLVCMAIFRVTVVADGPLAAFPPRTLRCRVLALAWVIHGSGSGGLTLCENLPRVTPWPAVSAGRGSALERVEASGRAFAPFLRLRHPYRSPP